MSIDRRGFLVSVAAGPSAAVAGAERVAGATGPDWSLHTYDQKRRRNNPDGVGLPDDLSDVGEIWREEVVPNAAPVVSGGTVYLGADDGVYALDARSGEKVWKYGTQESVSEPPAVYDGKVYAGTDEGRLVALSSGTGEEVWETGVGERVTTSPMPKGVDVFVGTNTHIRSLKASDGSENWSFETRVEAAAGPAVTDELAVVVDGALVFGLDRFTGERKWRSYTGGSMSEVAVEGTRVYSLGGSTVFAQRLRNGVDRWSQALRGEIVGGPVVTGGSMYVATDSGFIYSLGLRNEGWTDWKRQFDGEFVGSPVAVDGVVYGATRDGTEGRVYALDPSNGDVLGEYVVGEEVIEQDNDGETEGVVVNLVDGPTVAEGNAYLVTESGLRAFGGDGSRAPTAGFDVSPTDPSVGDVVRFDASSSSSGSAPIEAYNWTVRSDGNTTESSGETMRRVFESPGERTVSLTVTDERGLSDTGTRAVPVSEGGGGGVEASGAEDTDGGGGESATEGDRGGRVQEANETRDGAEGDGGILSRALKDRRQRILLALGSIGAVVSALGFSAYWRMEPESERLRKEGEKNAEEESAERDEEGTVICVDCGGSVGEGDSFCPDCGASLED